MVGTATPVVYGPNRWKRVIAIYALSQVAGALSTGLVLWAIGIAVRTLFAWDSAFAAAITSAVCAVGALHDLKLTTIWMPASRWQVPCQWKRYPWPLMAAMYGFGIGTGVLTRIPFASFHAVLIATILFADLPLALGVMLVYGATRAFAVAITSQLQLLISDVRQRTLTISRLAPLLGYCNGIILAAVAGICMGHSFSSRFQCISMF
jgi:hypothetical protein